MDDVRLILGDCLEVLPTLPADSVDAVVCDPPAGIAFMNLEFDTFPTRKRPEGMTFKDGRARPSIAERQEHRAGSRKPFIDFLTRALAECLRVAKPGAYALVWSIPRTSHWTGTALEDAGWVPVDVITHLFGSGFPKHKSKLKPAAEFWWLCWKPARHATPLQIDVCRLGVAAVDDYGRSAAKADGTLSLSRSPGYGLGKKLSAPSAAGRYPANVALTHHEECDGACHPDCPVRLLDEQAGERDGNSNQNLYARAGKIKNAYADGWERTMSGMGRADTGGPSRFFYCSKASRKTRGEGNNHPTVKADTNADGSAGLMRWLVRLVTPLGGLVLDPFAGSGSTGLACLAENRKFIGIEKLPEYLAIARRRLAEAAGPLFREALDPACE